MKILKKNKSVIYLIGIAIITFIRLTQDSELFNFNNSLVTVIKLLASAFFGIKLIIEKYNKKELIFIILLLIFSAVITYVTKIEMTMLTVIILIGLKNVDIKQVIKVIFYTSLIVVSTHIISYSFNYFFSSGDIKMLLTKDLQKRHYIYFSHPNMFASMIFGIILEWVYLFGYKCNKILKYSIILIVATITYFITISRTNLILFIALVVGLIALDVRNKNIKSIIKKLGEYSFTVITITTILFLIFYNNYQLELVNKIDNLLSGRITLGLIARDRYGVTIFPQYIDFTEKVDLIYIKELVVDNFYIKYSMLNGCIFLAIMCLCVIKGSKRCNELENLYLFLFSIWGITEGVIFDISISIILLILADKILNNKSIESKTRNFDNSKNRVLVFGMTENPGGVESVIMNYYRNINKENIQFDFLCNTENVAYEDEILKLGGNIYKITARSKNRKKYKNEMKSFFEEHSKDYSTIWVNVCSLANIDYLIYAKKYDIKYRIIHSHNSQNMDSKLRGILHNINKHLVKFYATDFWACSKDAEEWFYPASISKKKDVVMINNAIDTKKYIYNEKIRNTYRKELGIEDKLVIGNVGRLHFQKNHKFLIEIFKEILDKKENAVLLLVGQGEERRNIENQIQELGIKDKVIFLGVRQDVPELLQAMDIFVFPSVFEGFGIAVLESQAAGLRTYTSKDVVPKDVKVTKNIEYIPLESNAQEWAKIILDKELSNRQKQKEEILKAICDSGYDIKIEAQKIQRYLERN